MKLLAVSAMVAGLAVVIGAFGAHVLKQSLSLEMQAVYKTGVEYHFYHAFAAILACILYRISQIDLFKWSACLFLAGIMVFSGSLYVLALTQLKWLGAITPIGGLAFIIAWVLFACAAWRYPQND